MSVRAFLGIGLPPHARTTLEGCAAAIRAESRAWSGEKWVAPENLHVTLRFLGQIEEDDLAPTMEAVRVAAERVPEYSVTIGELAAVPRLRAASMLWATLGAGTDETAVLASAIEDALVPLGHERSAKVFSSHITLVRARKPRAIPFEALDAGNRFLYAATDRDKKMSVRGVTLYSSTLTPRGPVYEELAFASFAG